MPITAELRGPKRYNFRGKYLFERGKPVEIDRETAAVLDDDDRFKIRGYDPSLTPAKPKGQINIKTAAPQTQAPAPAPAAPASKPVTV